MCQVLQRLCVDVVIDHDHLTLCPPVDLLVGEIRFEGLSVQNKDFFLRLRIIEQPHKVVQVSMGDSTFFDFFNILFKIIHSFFDLAYVVFVISNPLQQGGIPSSTDQRIILSQIVFHTLE